MEFNDDVHSCAKQWLLCWLNNTYYWSPLSSVLHEWNMFSLQVKIMQSSPQWPQPATDSSLRSPYWSPWKERRPSDWRTAFHEESLNYKMLMVLILHLVYSPVQTGCHPEKYFIELIYCWFCCFVLFFVVASYVGRKVAKVVNSRLDTCSREVLRHEDLKNTVKIRRLRDHFICKSKCPLNLFINR